MKALRTRTPQCPPKTTESRIVVSVMDNSGQVFSVLVNDIGSKIESVDNSNPPMSDEDHREPRSLRRPPTATVASVGLCLSIQLDQPSSRLTIC